MNPIVHSHQERARVSITARLIPLFAFVFSALAGAAGSYHQIRSMQALKASENAGVGAISGALSEANILVIVLLSLSALLGITGLCVSVGRLFSTVTKATPPAYFFLPAAILGLLPVILFWAAQTLIVNAMMASVSRAGQGVLGIADFVFYLHMLSIIIAVVAFPVLAGAPFLPFSAHVRKRFGSLFVLVSGVGAILLLIALLVYRNLVLHQIWRDLG